MTMPTSPSPEQPDAEAHDLDGDYPTDAALAKIVAWPYTDLRGLFDFVHGIWYLADWGWSEPEPGHFEISTAGWSGNESIIEALMNNTMFWLTCWQESRRGGHYKFEIPAGLK
jgi:hypothetical protein